jgi:hypothetical protein
MSHFIYCYAECRYAEFRYAECHYTECRYAECRYVECCYTDCRGASEIDCCCLDTLGKAVKGHFYCLQTP